MTSAEKWAIRKASETPEQRAKRLEIQRRANQKRREKLNAFMREYARRPDVREHKIEYMKKYNSTPERKAIQKMHNNSDKARKHHERYKASGKTQEWDRAHKKRKHEAKALAQLAKIAAELELKQ